MKTGNIRATKSLRVDADPVDNNGVGNREYNDIRYCTGSEVDTISGSLQTNIDGKSDIAHFHDDRYYIESEVDTISGSLSSEIDSDISTHTSNSDAHHSESHNVASHSDTTASGAQLNTLVGGGNTTLHIHDSRYYTESEVDTISGSLQINIDGKSNTNHLHDDRYYTETELNNGQLDNRYYTESEINTISGSLNTKINDKADVIHIHDDRYYTETEIDTISGSLQTNINGKSNLTHTHDDRYYTETELNNGQLDTRYYTELEVDDLITTVSGKLDDHNELNNLDYASAGHTGFQPAGDYATDSELTTLSGSLQTNIDGKSDTGHTHDDRYYTESEIDTISGSLNTSKSDVGHSHTESDITDLDKYTESEIDTISGSLQTGIDGDKFSTKVIVDVINTPTYRTLQNWIDNTQSAGRMSGGDTTTHSDNVTGVTVSGAGSGEFKVSGNQIAGYIVGEPILVSESTNNNGTYTVASGVSFSVDTTTIPVDEAVGAIADGSIVNGTVDVADGTGFVKSTDVDTGNTISFNLHADTNILLTDVVTNYLYVDYNVGIPDIKVTTDQLSIEKNRQFMLSMVYRNGARVWSCSCGIYLPNRTRLDHDRIIALRGYERASGGEISEYGTRNIQSTAGLFFRGPSEINTTSKASDTDKLTTAYYDGSNWVWTEDETQIDNTYYNNISTGLVELGVNKYAVHWVCIDYLSNLYVVYGRDSYSLAEAELATIPSLIPVVANMFGIIAAKIIIQKGDSSFTELTSAYTQLIRSTTPTTHNDLSGLDEGDYQHLTAAQKTDLTDGNDCSSHKHDDRYYTELEVDTISGSLNIAKSDVGHSHTESDISDLDKYTQVEVDGLITTISGKLDDHNELNNLDYASAGHTGFQPSGDYATDSELTTLSGNLQTNIDGKSDTAHLHDDRYYTETELNNGQLDNRYYIETEIDTISGSLNTKIESKDNYQNWKFAVDGVTKDDITSEDTLNFVGGDNITITRSADDEITISGSAGEYGVKLDSLLSADGKYSGITCDGILGATLAFGDLVYLNTTDQRWELTDANAEATAGNVQLAIVLAAGNDGETKLLLLQGFIREDDWNFTSYGQALFVSCTAGDMTQDVSGYTTGDVVRVIGYTSTFADQIYFNPDGVWLEIT